MNTIVVLGGGIGGLSAAFELKDELGGSHEIILVSDQEHFEFTPSNPWVAVKWRKPEAIRLDLNELMPKHGIRFIGTAVKKVQPESHSLLLENDELVSYNYLVIASGPRLAFDEIPGLGPHGGYTQSVCKTDHASLMAEKFDEFCANPGPVVIGAAQGASCYGPAYEYTFIIETELRKRKIRDKVPMFFVTPEPYVGHLGLDGVGDTKSMMESELRERHVKWFTNSRIDRVDDGVIKITQVNDDGSDKASHEIEFAHSMILPAFTGIEAVMGVDGLSNPRGFIVVDKHQRNPTYPDIFAVGVCVAIPPVGSSPLPVGVPKTGYMIESMVTATVQNIVELLAGKEPTHTATWNAFCLADFGDRGVAFMALPQIPPRNTNWSGSGKWVHWAKVGFEKYYLRKIKQGKVEPFWEKYALRLMGVQKLKGSARA
ncbi:MAG: NAD(P)/FAD-dependent oxidoreductase [Xanthomonadales bacterium]|jgi:sulfide:quinone oxidoreductase|nr:NAD(P)/FAD-dependent oxidoreductase [Xanthomonadales bacterium]MDH3939409.1 NAD(P)/FAD-dependent oxidoreductase [Xanthomonadales bacterium]MDH4002371.1 NAD(P)/FAD-dependent oxidoreductase [Xanthomonadales bacterium]